MARNTKILKELNTLCDHCLEARNQLDSDVITKAEDELYKFITETDLNTINLNAAKRGDPSLFWKIALISLNASSDKILRHILENTDISKLNFNVKGYIAAFGEVTALWLISFLATMKQPYCLEVVTSKADLTKLNWNHKGNEEISALWLAAEAGAKGYPKALNVILAANLPHLDLTAKPLNGSLADTSVQDLINQSKAREKAPRPSTSEPSSSTTPAQRNVPHQPPQPLQPNFWVPRPTPAQRFNQQQPSFRSPFLAPPSPFQVPPPSPWQRPKQPQPRPSQPKVPKAPKKPKVKVSRSSNAPTTPSVPTTPNVPTTPTSNAPIQQNRFISLLKIPFKHPIKISLFLGISTSIALFALSLPLMTMLLSSLAVAAGSFTGLKLLGLYVLRTPEIRVTASSLSSQEPNQDQDSYINEATRTSLHAYPASTASQSAQADEGNNNRPSVPKRVRFA